MIKNYDTQKPESILEKALELKDKSLQNLYPEILITYEGKGGLGQLVERIHFGYKPNSNQSADFEKAGVELKTTPLKKLKNGKYNAKERLAITNIDFGKLINEEFVKSDLLKKIDLILLMCYMYEKDVWIENLIFKIIKLWNIPEDDYKIIKQDWEVIQRKVKAGEAHLISSSDTYYLEAATTGKGKGRDFVNQSQSNIKAKRRRFALKRSYVDTMITEELGMLQSFLPDDFDYDKLSIEEYLIKSFEPYYGFSQHHIKEKFNLQFSENSKHSSFLIAKAILGISLDKEVRIEEFEKAGIKIKTITLDKNGNLKESMSFPQIDFDEIKEVDYENSFFYNEVVSSKYLFVIFKKDKKEGKFLERVLLWNMGTEEEEVAEEFWKDIKKNIMKRNYNNFWKTRDKKIFHVRPKAKNAEDKRVLINGDVVKKYAYWINRKKVLEIITAE